MNGFPVLRLLRTLRHLFASSVRFIRSYVPTYRCATIIKQASLVPLQVLGRYRLDSNAYFKPVSLLLLFQTLTDNWSLCQIPELCLLFVMVVRIKNFHPFEPSPIPGTHSRTVSVLTAMGVSFPKGFHQFLS